jgi:hypothetical protein
MPVQDLKVFIDLHISYLYVYKNFRRDALLTSAVQHHHGKKASRRRIGKRSSTCFE